VSIQGVGWWGPKRKRGEIECKGCGGVVVQAKVLGKKMYKAEEVPVIQVWMGKGRGEPGFEPTLPP
jgi:hypothetical protein